MNARGVTLVELLVVIVIVAILASIAIPSYRNNVMRTTRSSATTNLLAVRAAQEKFYLANNAYSNDLAGAPPVGLGQPATTADGKYQLALVLGAAGQSYTVTATPVAGKGQDQDADCTTLTINETGVKSATGAHAAKCWK